MTESTVAHQQGADNKYLRTPVIVGAMIVVALAAVATILASLGAAETKGGGAKTHAEPATVEHVAGSDLARITLTAKASERLDIQTAATSARGVGRAQRLVVPYSSLIYDAGGGTWAYVSTEPLVFERVAVAVASIRGDQVFLSEGPPAGTHVVIVGAAELFGAEFGVGH